MSSASTPVFKIAPTTQQYDWGKTGSSAKVAQFAAASRLPGFTVDESAPYAELWMGTHVTSPSRVYETGEILSEHLAKHPELIGDAICAKFNARNGHLPFLFKVLSINKALSIQSHPDKPTAEKLHALQPHIYKDPNHKPEMALALTPFHALCGFRPLPHIASSLSHTPEFASLVPASIQSTFHHLSTSTDEKATAALRALFEAVMTADEATFKPQLDALVRRYERGDVREGEQSEMVELVRRLESQFPGDIGVFCVFLLNPVTLEPGEAIFLGAGEPHAYVSGECIECMANSDNVIRAGLTPKLRDIPNLISTLTYTPSPPSKHYVSPRPFTLTSTLYAPPIPEFSVIQLKLAPGEKETHPPIDGPSVLIVTDGEGVLAWEGEAGGTLVVGRGDVAFVGAQTEVRFEAGKGMVGYRAFVEDEG